MDTNTTEKFNVIKNAFEKYIQNYSIRVNL
jgi:hypothetical protein